MSRARSVYQQIWPRLAGVGGVLVVWWLFARSGFFEPAIFAPPGSVWDTLQADLFSGGELWAATIRSLLRISVGVLVALVVGTPIGLAMAASRSFQRSVGSLMTGLQSLPSITWAPLAMLWFGLNEQAVQFIVVIAGIPAVAIATASSVLLVPPLLIRAGRSLGASGLGLYRHVILPAAIPGFMGGLQQAWSLAWRALMAGELLVATGARGLGHFMDVRFNQIDAAGLMAAMVVIIAIGVGVDFLLGTVDRRVRGRRGLLVPN